MNTEAKVLVLQDLLVRVRARARQMAASPTALSVNERAERLSDAPTQMTHREPAAKPVQLSLPAPVRLTAVFADSDRVALFQGAVAASSPPRTFVECA